MANNNKTKSKAIEGDDVCNTAAKVAKTSEVTSELSCDNGTALSGKGFQPPSPSRGFGSSTRTTHVRVFPTVEVSYDPIALLGFVELAPPAKKKTQFLGALSLPPTLSDNEREIVQSKLTKEGFFTKVAKKEGDKLIMDDKISKGGKQYILYQWMFLFWIDSNEDLKNQLETKATTFLDVSYLSIISNFFSMF
jgi:hypothetical protein